MQKEFDDHKHNTITFYVSKALTINNNKLATIISACKRLPKESKAIDWAQSNAAPTIPPASLEFAHIQMDYVFWQLISFFEALKQEVSVDLHIKGVWIKPFSVDSYFKGIQRKVARSDMPLSASTDSCFKARLTLQERESAAF